jgi:tetraacyldisaccharide 4'-kinase
MHIKGNSALSKITVFLLNGVSILFKTISLLNLKRKSLRPAKFPALVISVDNLSFGGAGKTTLVTEIGKNLEQKNMGFAIVTRGYKAKLEGRGAKVEPHHHVDDVGDEAILYRRRFGSGSCFPHPDVYVGKNRRRSIENAVRKGDGHKIILLDDGFQSTHIHKDIKIMLFNPCHPYYYLRNFKRLMKKEDFIYFYRRVPPGAEKKYSPAVCGVYDFEILHFCTAVGTIMAPDDIRRAALLGFSALGDNQRFKNDLSAFRLVEFIPFRDHHVYTEKEIRALNARRIEKKADYLVCTEKDFIKLTSINMDDIPLIYVQNSIKLNPNLMDYVLENAKYAEYAEYAGKQNNLQT